MPALKGDSVPGYAPWQPGAQHVPTGLLTTNVWQHRYTGIFASGGIGLARLSLGAQKGNFKPGA